MTGRQTAATGSCPTGSGSVALLPEHRITSTWGVGMGMGMGHCSFFIIAQSNLKPSSSEMEEEKRGGGGAIGFSSCHRKQQANTSGMEV